MINRTNQIPPPKRHIDLAKGIIYHIEEAHGEEGGLYGNPYTLSLYRIYPAKKEVHLLNGPTDRKYYKLARTFRYLGYTIRDKRK